MGFLRLLRFLKFCEVCEFLEGSQAIGLRFLDIIAEWPAVCSELLRFLKFLMFLRFFSFVNNLKFLVVSQGF